MARGENQYSILPPGETNPHKGSIIVGVKENAIEARDTYHPGHQIYLTWSEKTGKTMELIDKGILVDENKHLHDYENGYHIIGGI